MNVKLVDNQLNTDYTLYSSSSISNELKEKNKNFNNFLFFFGGSSGKIFAVKFYLGLAQLRLWI